VVNGIVLFTFPVSFIVGHRTEILRQKRDSSTRSSGRDEDAIGV